MPQPVDTVCARCAVSHPQKYAPLFERERIGMLELPYMTEDRLQKLGVPIGPRLRILHEAQLSMRADNPNVYIL